MEPKEGWTEGTWRVEPVVVEELRAGKVDDHDGGRGIEVQERLRDRTI